MKVIDPGCSYELAGGNGLVFLQMEGGRIVRDGTTSEEVLEVLIERVTAGYQPFPCRERIRALYLLREALAALQQLSDRLPSANDEGASQPHTPVVESVEALLGRIASCERDAQSPLPAALADRIGSDEIMRALDEAYARQETADALRAELRAERVDAGQASDALWAKLHAECVDVGLASRRLIRDIERAQSPTSFSRKPGRLPR